MLKFVIRRLGVAILVTITVSIVCFSLLRLAGDLAADLAGEDATEQEIAAVAKAYGLDRPLYVQYLEWAGSALRGDLGRSLFTNEPVFDAIASKVGVTLLLASLGIVFALSIAIPLGVAAASRPNSWLDRFSLGVAVFGQAMPTFWLALLLMLNFAVHRPWFPVSGSETLWHFVLPMVSLGTIVMPSLMRLTRSGMIQTLQSDFIRTARAKGLAPMTVFFKHALRVAILPVVSLASVQFGFMLAGSVVIERIFALDGIGFLALEAIERADFPIVQSIVVFVSVVYIVLTLLSDIINAQLDPRIRLS